MQISKNLSLVKSEGKYKPIVNESLFMIPVSLQKISRKEGMALAIKLFDCFPHSDKSGKETYLDAVSSIFQQYSVDQGKQVIRQIFSEKKFIPSGSEIIEEFEKLVPIIAPFNATREQWQEVCLSLKDKSPLWLKICQRIEKNIGIHNFKYFFTEIETDDLESPMPTLIMVSPFCRNQLETKYRNEIESAFESEIENFKFITYQVKDISIGAKS